MIPLLDVILDEWVRPQSPASPSSPVTWVEYCCKVLAATPPWQRGHWVMGARSYLAIQAEVAVSGAYRFDPASSDSMPTLLGLPIVIMGGGSLPRIESGS